MGTRAGLKKESRCSLKIVHIIRTLLYGGVEHGVMLLAQEQAVRGHHMRIISMGEPPESELVDELARAGVDFVHIPKRGGFNPFLVSPLRRAIAGYDIVHSYLHLHHYALLAGAGRHRCWIAWIAGGLASRPVRPAEFVTFRLSSRAASHLVAAAELLTKSHSFRRAFGSRKFEVIPAPVDTEQLTFNSAQRRMMREELGLADAAPLIFNIGRVEAVKDPLRFIAVAREMMGTYPQVPVNFLWVGAGSMLDAAREASVASRGRIRFLGRVPKVEGFLNAADALLMTSHREGVPLTALEARANGLPVLAPEFPGLRDLAGKAQDVHLYPCDATPSEIGARLKEIIATPRKFAPDEYVLKHCSPSAVADAYEKLYPESQ